MNWHKDVSAADTPEALLAVVNEYLLGFPEASWSWIPRELRPPLMATVEELHQWHHLLAERLKEATSPNIRMQDLCVFFLHASARAIELRDQAASCNDGACTAREAG